MRTALLLALLSLFSAQAYAGPAEAFEVTTARIAELPGGKEADGIPGDFILRNDHIEAVIAGNLPHRRANFLTFSGKGGETPGCLYDLCPRGSNNDELTILAPNGERGMMSWVKVVEGEDAAVVEAVRTAELGGGIRRTHRYTLDEDSRALVILSILENRSDAPKSTKGQDYWKPFGAQGTFRGIRFGDAIDPAAKSGYAVAFVDGNGQRAKSPPATLELGPNETQAFTRVVAVATSPAAAAGIVQSSLGETGTLEARLLGSGKGVPEAKLTIHHGDSDKIVGYPDAEGLVAILLAPGDYRLVASSIGRKSVDQQVRIEADGKASFEADLGPVAGIQFAVTDGAGAGIPCKAQFAGINGTANPNLGPQNRAHGCRDQFHSERGEFFVNLPAGEYRVTLTRGIEHSHVVREVTVAEGAVLEFKASLERVVDTTGWVSTDFHNHSTPSGDNTCGTADRLINLAAEQIEFAPTTEHNRIIDWAPEIERLGLSPVLKTIPGIELTGSGTGAHMNAFPLKPDPTKQDGGAPRHDPDPRVNALHLANLSGQGTNTWVHINHPDLQRLFLDRNGDGKTDGGFVALGGMVNAIETENYTGQNILATAPFEIQKDARRPLIQKVRFSREFVWLQELNQGFQPWAIAVADAHSVYGNGVGGWRTFIPCSTDNPSEITWEEICANAKAGRMVLSSGPFLEVKANGEVLPGGSLETADPVELQVRVQCTDWIQIDRVQVLVNGRQEPTLNFTRESHPKMFREGVVRFEETIQVPLKEDAHLIVVAQGENHNLGVGFGTSGQRNIRPTAYNNPIFVDVDGGGFTPNGDTLGHERHGVGLTVDRARAILER